MPAYPMSAPTDVGYPVFAAAGAMRSLPFDMQPVPDLPSAHV